MTKSPVEIVRAILEDPTNPDTVHALVAPDATYSRVLRYWTSEAFDIRDMFASGEDVAVFGSFTYRSTTLGKAVTSPFSILAKVCDGRVTYMQFMEDTFGTAATFRMGGTAVFHSDPESGEVSL